MPRCARILASTGIYHVMLRGNERKSIVVDDEDRRRFIDIIIDKCQDEAEIIAYCLMDNHIHILIRPVINNLDLLMKRISVSYVYYFNKKYKRIGHLFQDRFKSQNIESEGYLLEALRYIHNNPVKAGVVKNPLEYKWSSHIEYFKTNPRIKGAVEKILDIFSQDKDMAKQLFREFCGREGGSGFIDYDGKTIEERREKQERDAFAQYIIMLSSVGLQGSDLLTKENQAIRDEIIQKLKCSFSLSIRQISIVTGIGRGMVQKVISRIKDNDGNEVNGSKTVLFT